MTAEVSIGTASRPAVRRRRLPASIAAAIVFLGLVVLVAAAASWVAPYDYALQDLRARLRPPLFFGGNWDHLLGTDNLGRDILSRMIYGARTSVLIAVAATLIGSVFGTTMGFLAAHFRRWVEEAVMGLVDLQAALPTLILALAILAFLGNNIVLFIILVALDGWERYARLARGMVLAAKTSGYVLSMRAIGASSERVYLGQILPNVLGGLIVQATLNFPGTIILETSLSFLGLGIQPPATSLGQMLGQGRNFLLNAWWISVFPGSVLFLTTLAMCLVGDWLRDRIDPTVQ